MPGISDKKWFCAHCGLPVAGHGNARVHPECKKEYNRVKTKEWIKKNPDRAKENVREWHRNHPNYGREYNKKRDERLLILASAMVKLLEGAGISIEEFLEMENGKTPAISRKSIGAPSAMVRGKS